MVAFEKRVTLRLYTSSRAHRRLGALAAQPAPPASSNIPLQRNLKILLRRSPDDESLKRATIAAVPTRVTCCISANEVRLHCIGVCAFLCCAAQCLPAQAAVMLLRPGPPAAHLATPCSSRRSSSAPRRCTVCSATLPSVPYERLSASALASVTEAVAEAARLGFAEARTSRKLSALLSLASSPLTHPRAGWLRAPVALALAAALRRRLGALSLRRASRRAAQVARGAVARRGAEPAGAPHAAQARPAAANVVGAAASARGSLSDGASERHSVA